MVARVCFAVVGSLVLGCSRTPAPATDLGAPDAAVRSPTGTASAAEAPPGAFPGPALPAGAARCATTKTTDGKTLACTRFPTAESAFQWVLAHEPQILAIGEAHAPKGSEAIPSTTKRFTETLLPLVSPKASDVVVELWAPDPKCQKEVKAVASAQKPVTTAQAATNQNEYLTLGTKAKELGMTPWLLRPTCDDFGDLADAGEDAVGKMLSLVKRLTQEKLVQLRTRAQPNGKMVLAYGGAMHNDLFPGADTRSWSFGPELQTATQNAYVELDLIVPEYIKDGPAWQKLPWYGAYEAEAKAGRTDRATVYQLSERSFTIVLPVTR